MNFYIIVILSIWVNQYQTALVTPKVKVLGNTIINTLGLLSWDPNYANLPINQACEPWNDTKNCSNKFNPFTFSTCQVLTYFNTPVCGGQSCYFNQTSQKCDGQCSNPILQKCVSKTESPQSDVDCTCASSIANPVVLLRGQPIQIIPSCDASTCFLNSCSFFYVSINRLKNATLYAACNNN